MGNVDLAAAEIMKLIAPFQMKFVFLACLLSLSSKQFNRKINCYLQCILKVEPKNSAANVALAEHYRINNNHLKAFDYLTLFRQRRLRSADSVPNTFLLFPNGYR